MDQPKDKEPNTPPSSLPPSAAALQEAISSQTVRASIDRGRQGSSATALSQNVRKRKRWTLGILADDITDEVPGTVLLLSKFSTRNIPLGLHHEQRRRSTSRGSIAAEADRRRSLSQSLPPLKKSQDGKVILDPQPDDSENDPLNWPSWRRDASLFSLGFYCMLGGGMTPILAAGFNNVAATFHVTYAEVARTTGYYMLGMGVGSVFFSPTAILYGKRPIYLASALLFITTSVWCAVSPDYVNLAVARVFQGIAVSPVECLPSATIAEIFFLHERAFRVGIYTLLLLGGKNLVPLVSAVIIQALGWRWVFFVVAIVVGFGGALLFLFVPETFWDRTPRPRGYRPRSNSLVAHNSQVRPSGAGGRHKSSQSTNPNRLRRPSVTAMNNEMRGPRAPVAGLIGLDGNAQPMHLDLSDLQNSQDVSRRPEVTEPTVPSSAVRFEDDPTLPALHNLNSPYYLELEKNHDYMDFHQGWAKSSPKHDDILQPFKEQQDEADATNPLGHELDVSIPRADLSRVNTNLSYTGDLKQKPTRGWVSTLKPWNGRLSNTNWLKAAIRPFVLFAYPSVLWSALIYALSVGWLIVLSESVSAIYINRATYNFNSLQVGLVYMSPFIGGILGTAVAGRVSDLIVRWMARRNDGIYEPEYRLVMAGPILITTVAGLMGFGWSAAERDAWIVPTIFFGMISFGCSLGSTTAITFCVDSYRQYAGEALVTLNFSKNIFHGLVFSLFFPQWLQANGSKNVFVAIGGIQIICLLFTIPMYIYGKRARMWTVRTGMMDRF